MNTLAATQEQVLPVIGLTDDAASMREAKRLCDDSTLLMLLAIATMVAVPWFLRDLEINLAPVTWSLFIYGIVALAASRLAEELARATALRVAVTGTQIGNIVFAAWVWHLAGSLQHPLFLLIFALPVASQAWTLKPPQAIALTLAAIGAAVAVALVNSPELRWYLAQMGVPSAILPGGTGTSVRPFPGIELPASYQFLLLVTFALAMTALGLAAQSGAMLLARTRQRLASSQHALKDAQTLAAELLRVSPHPAALIYTDTFNVAFASDSFLEEMLLLPETLQERNLFGLIAFSYPELVRKLLEGAGGEIPLAVYKVDGQLRMAAIEVRPLEHGGVRYAALFMHDAARQFFVEAAQDALPAAIIIVGEDRRIRYANQAAKSFFPEIQAGMDVTTLFRQPDGVEDWWDLGQRARRERTVVLAGKNYHATCQAVRIPGEVTRATVVSLQESAR